MATRHPIIRGYAPGYAQTSPGRVEFTLPSWVQPGDLLIAAVYLGWGTANDGIVPPSGWTKLLTQNNAAGDISTWIFYKVAQGGDSGATISFIRTSKNDTFASGVICILKGAGTPLAIGTSTSVTTSLNWPFQTCQAGDLAIRIAHGANQFSVNITGYAEGPSTNAQYASSISLVAGVGAGAVGGGGLATASGYYNLVSIRVPSAISDSLPQEVRAWAAAAKNTGTLLYVHRPINTLDTDTVIVCVVAGSSITPPSGWTPLIPMSQRPSGAYVGIWYKAPVGSGSLGTWSQAFSNPWGVVVVSIPGGLGLSDATAFSIAPPGPIGTASGATLAIPIPGNTSINDLVLALGGSWPVVNHPRYIVAKPPAFSGGMPPINQLYPGTAIVCGAAPLYAYQLANMGDFAGDSGNLFEGVVVRIPGISGGQTLQRKAALVGAATAFATPTLARRRYSRINAVSTGAGATSLLTTRAGRIQAMATATISVEAATSRAAKISSLGSGLGGITLSRRRLATTNLLAASSATPSLAKERKAALVGIALAASYASIALARGVRLAAISVSAASTGGIFRHARLSMGISGVAAFTYATARHTRLSLASSGVAAFTYATARHTRLSMGISGVAAFTISLTRYAHIWISPNLAVSLLPPIMSGRPGYSPIYISSPSKTGYSPVYTSRLGVMVLLIGESGVNGGGG